MQPLWRQAFRETKELGRSSPIGPKNLMYCSVRISDLRLSLSGTYFLETFLYIHYLESMENLMTGCCERAILIPSSLIMECWDSRFNTPKGGQIAGSSIYPPEYTGSTNPELIVFATVGKNTVAHWK
jgi:hypothetical protein